MPTPDPLIITTAAREVVGAGHEFSTLVDHTDTIVHGDPAAVTEFFTYFDPNPTQPVKLVVR